MLQKPTTGQLLKQGEADSRFRLVIATSKRARQIASGYPKMVETDNHNPVTVAAEEIYEQKVEINKED